MWDKLSELKQSINGGITPKDLVTLKTKTIKLALAGYLAQSLIVAFSWVMRDGNGLAWLIPISAFIHIGWFWNKCIDSWKKDYHYQPMAGIDVSTATNHPPPTPPNINISNSPITTRQQPPLAGSMDSLWHTAPESSIL